MSTMPDARGRFGDFGGRFVPETVMGALDELLAAWQTAWSDPAFHERLDLLARDYVGRPSPLYRAERLEEYAHGARIYLKREDLNHTGAHKINNAVGQALLAERLGKRRIVAETGAGQHGVASATVCARFGLDCHVYMGEEDIRRQHPNVVRMRMLGAEVIPVTAGSGTLKDAMNEAIRDWITNVEDTHYLIGSAAGPHPYPVLVRELQSVIGREAREQVLAAEGRLPDLVVACVGGGSNAIGLFHPFIEDADVRLLGAEAGGDESGTAATLSEGRVSVLHGSKSYVLADEGGQVLETHSISAGLDYPGVGPEHAWLKDTGRAEYAPVTDAQALEAFHLLCMREGIIPALESAHALWLALQRAAARAGRGGGAVGARRQGRGRGRGAGVAGVRIETPALVIYLMADHDTVELAEAAVRGGATALEIGIPFSDPLADGPTVQRAGQRALRNGMTATRALEVIGELRRRIAGAADPDDLRGAGDGVRRGAVLRRPGRGRRRRHDRAGRAARRGRRPDRGLPAERAGHGADAGADQHRRAHRAGLQRRGRIRVPGVGGGHHRVAAGAVRPGGAAGRACAPAHRAAAAGGVRDRLGADGARGDGRGRRRRRHRQQGDRGVRGRRRGGAGAVRGRGGDGDHQVTTINMSSIATV